MLIVHIANFAFVDDILYIDHDDEEAVSENVMKNKSPENVSLTTSVSDNTFYDTDGVHKLNVDTNVTCSHQTNSNSLTDKRDAQHQNIVFSDCTSTVEDISFFDDQSGALQSVFGHDFHSITPLSQSSDGAYSFAKKNK